MPAKKNSSRQPAVATNGGGTHRRSVTDGIKPREIISTCQIKTSAGTPVTWTAFRRVGAPSSAAPDCYMCTLPDNTSNGDPSSYNLRSICAQAKRFPIKLTALDRDVTYVVSEAGKKPKRVRKERGEPYVVPPRGKGAGATSVALTFAGDYCTLEAVPQRPEKKRQLPASGAVLMAMDGDGDPPQPLPDGEQDSENDSEN